MALADADSVRNSSLFDGIVGDGTASHKPVLDIGLGSYPIDYYLGLSFSSPSGSLGLGLAGGRLLHVAKSGSYGSFSCSLRALPVFDVMEQYAQ